MTREVFSRVELTPQLVAEWFEGSGSDVQAEFLNEVGKRFADAHADYDTDMQFIHLVSEIDAYGKRLLFALANWLKARNLDGLHWQRAMDAYPDLSPYDAMTENTLRAECHRLQARILEMEKKQ